MNRTSSLTLALVIGAGALTGCGAAADKVAEKATEKAIESQTGGDVDANAAFTVFLATPVSRAISEIDTSSPRSRRISAHSFTLITRSRFTTRWSKFTRRSLISFQASPTRGRSAPTRLPNGRGKYLVAMRSTLRA